MAKHFRSVAIDDEQHLNPLCSKKIKVALAAAIVKVDFYGCLIRSEICEQVYQS